MLLPVTQVLTSPAKQQQHTKSFSFFFFLLPFGKRFVVALVAVVVSPECVVLSWWWWNWATRWRLEWWQRDTRVQHPKAIVRPTDECAIFFLVLAFVVCFHETPHCARLVLSRLLTQQHSAVLVHLQSLFCYLSLSIVALKKKKRKEKGFCPLFPFSPWLLLPFFLSFFPFCCCYIQRQSQLCNSREQFRL